MANLLMWYQGNAGSKFPNCDGGPEFQCPVSKRIAAEYGRDHFTLTNVVNPNLGDYGHNEGWLNRAYDEVEAGDILWLILVPPVHCVEDVAIITEETMAEFSSMESLGGAVVTLVGAKFEAADDETGLCAPVGSVTDYNVVNFAAGELAKPTADRTKTDIFLAPTEWYGVGIRIDTMPTDAVSLADITAKIAVVAHVQGYDSQIHM